ncbi:FUSC family protein [Klugiella xanthotipulae]|uniref:Fusaric acid resistance family protein n=1 Tax=Klugiella xanthotipulae TaxID=244735 RepID=A0A543HXN1_9MICO|nr:FUSC family protein [Klugiella xanthotipulae]TQM63097.1 fusaric acid resistance family protein [Klugiella xanthotipulae]
MNTPTHTAVVPHPREFLRLGPHDGAHRVALRVTAAVIVPLALLCAMGRPEWGPYAVFGSMLSTFGRSMLRRPRLLMQAEAGAALVTVVTLGTSVSALGAPPWIAVLAASVVAIATSLLSDARGWKPGGPLFFVFGFTVTAWIPATPASIAIAATCAAGSALYALTIGYAGLALPHVRRHARSLNLRGGGSTRALSHTCNMRLTPSMILRALLCGTASAIAGLISLGLGLGFSYWAMIAAIVPVVSGATATQLLRAGHRILGTLLGLILTGALLLLPLNLVGLVVVIGVVQVGAELLVARNYGLALIFITPLALLMMHLARPLPVADALCNRAVDTVVGVAVVTLLLLATHKLRSGVERMEMVPNGITRLG